MIIRKNLPFFNVVADGVATLELELGMTYDRVVLVLGGTTFTKAMITNIKAKINGKLFYEISGSRLDTINKYKGIFDDATHLTIDFTEINAKTVGGEHLGAIGTAEGVDSFTLEVTIAGATAPTLASYSMLSPPRPLLPVLSIVHHPVTLSAGGKYPVVLPYGRDSNPLIKRVHFFHSNMTELEVKKNGVEIFEDVPVAINEFLQKEYALVPQAGLYVYDTVMKRNQQEMLVTNDARTLQFNPTVSAADTLNIYAELLADINQL